jgi:hypothetical protein
MKKHLLLALVIIMTLTSCDVITIEIEPPPPVVHKKDPKPLAPVMLGCIRGYFGDNYRTFAQHIEKVQPVDSFSNVYFYGSCGNTLKQINLIRCDQEFVLAIYILGYSLDSLPASLPVPVEYGKYAEIQFYPFQSGNSTSPGHYSLSNFYGKSVFITDITDDVVTGTFEGTLRSSTGETLPVTDGEFKLSLFRKYMPCGKPGGK